MTATRIIDLVLHPARWPLLGALASGALLAGAFAFEHLGGLPPCPLCITQRWAHAAALAFGLASFAAIQISGAVRRVSRLLSWILGLLFLVSLYWGVTHAGIEYGLWAGPASCTASGGGAISLAELNAALSERTNVVLCDEIAWSLLGISMAGWNAIISAALGAMSFASAFRNTEL
ncbi:disulfide bond formation protein B [Marinicauda algicola]|uniref:Disulfide bond formation protein B n=1 Tax=Marinicauda algicola TaxID=2029849 RepID=A0A4V3RYG6_9PROT|nr:disulfide bond formation protein B [Marinicauda algicola]TGY90219.1 disulfide bond formation protein B [Marinicauda algicola]